LFLRRQYAIFIILYAMVAENVRNIRARIEAACHRAGRSVDSVTLIAVAKTFGPELFEEAIAAGVKDIGENEGQ